MPLRFFNSFLYSLTYKLVILHLPKKVQRQESVIKTATEQGQGLFEEWTVYPEYGRENMSKFPQGQMWPKAKQLCYLRRAGA